MLAKLDLLRNSVFRYFEIFCGEAFDGFAAFILDGHSLDDQLRADGERGNGPRAGGPLLPDLLRGGSGCHGDEECQHKPGHARTSPETWFAGCACRLLKWADRTAGW